MRVEVHAVRRPRAGTRSRSGRPRSSRRRAMSRRRKRTEAGCPWSGEARGRRERLIAAWTTIIAVAPAARNPAKASGARRAARRPRQATMPKQATSPAAPTKPSSSPTIAKMKSVCGERQEEELLPAAAEPVAEPAAGAHCDEGLDGLEALAERVGLRVDERQDPGAAIVRREQHGRERGMSASNPVEEEPRPRAGQPEKHGAEHHVAGGGAEVRLEHDDARGREGEHESRQQGQSPFAAVSLLRESW